MNRIPLALLVPTGEEMTVARGRIHDPDEPGDIHASAGGVLSGLLTELRVALIQGDQPAVARVVREMTAVDRAANALLSERLETAMAEYEAAVGGAR